jgi:hypothetical protein
MEEKRIKLYQGMKSDGLEKTYKEFISTYFSKSQGVDKLYNALIDNGDFDEPLKSFYEKFCCDLSWAKTTQYCGGSEGDETNTPNWDKYPCVVELAKSKGVSLGNSGEYLIGDFKYFANGRKGILSTGKVVDFTCNDPEFKKISSTVGSQSTQIPSELKDNDGVKKFQDWLDVNHPGWHRKYGTLNKNLLRGYGKYGPNTNRAWNNQSYKDEYLKTSNSTATPSSESPSNWMDLFPSCVKGLKSFYNPPNNYFFGFGTDTEGAQYMIGYYSQKFKNGQRCEIYKDGSLVGNGFYSCTTNNQQITIKTLSGLSITGSVINPDYGNITSTKNDDETLEPSDDDVLKDNKVRVSKNTGI